MTSNLYRVFEQPETIVQRFNGYILAERCANALPEDRKLIFTIQAIVLREKSLEQFLARFRAAFPNAIGLRNVNVAGDGNLSREQTNAVRSETGWTLPLHGELKRRSFIDDLLGSKWNEEEAYNLRAPAHYSKAEIREQVSEGWESMADVVTKFCLAGFDRDLSEPWWWENAKTHLNAFVQQGVEARLNASVQTSVGVKIFETLDLARATKRLVVLDGSSRIGKTFAVKAWCDSHPDEAVYVQTPSKPNEQSFLAAMMEAVGIPFRPGSNLGPAWARLEAFLRLTGKMMVFDEGHFLISPGRYTLPHRLAWILTAIVNQGCPCAIVTTPQFLRAQEQIATRTNWNATQFIGRILVHQELGDVVTFEEMVNVVKNIFPNASEAAALAVATYAEKSHAYMEGIGFTADIARSLANGRDVKDAEIRAALKRLNRSGESLAQRLQTASKPPGKASKMKVVPQVETESENARAESPVNRISRRNISPTIEVSA